MANLIISNTLDGTFVLEKLKQNLKKGEKQLIIVPDRVVLSYETRTLEYLGIVGSFDIEVVSFSRLADLYLKKENKKIFNNQSQMMLIRKVIEENKSKLLYYKTAAGYVGFSNEVLKVINQIRLNNITTSDLSKLLESLPEKYQNKAKDILLIYNKYLEASVNSCYDAVSKLEVIKEAADKGEYCNYNIYICEFTYFNKLEYDIIFSLLKNQDVDKKFYIGVIESNDDNKHIYPKTRQSIEALVKDAGCDLQKEYINEVLDEEFEEIRKNLFSYKIPDNNIKSNKVQLMMATDIEEEVQGVANQIKAIISKGDQRYKDMSIVCCDIDNYKSSIQSIFRRNNIPFYMDVKTSLYNQSFIKQLLFACKTVLNGYRQEDVIAYLKEMGSTKEGNAINYFENYILKYGLNYEKGFKQELKYGTEYELAKAKKYQEKLLDNLSPLENIKGKTVKEYVNAIKDFMQKVEAEKTCEDFALEQEEKSFIVEASITRQVCSKLNEILSQLSAILGECEMSFEKFVQILESTISSQEISTIPMYIDCVYIGSVNKTVYMKKDYMFVMGANDGLFPSETTEVGLISPHEYLEWNKHGVCIYPNVYDVNSIERLNVLTILLKAKKGLQVSYPKSDISGAELQASPVIEYLQDILKTEVYSFGKIEDDTPIDLMIKNITSKKNVLLELIKLKEQVEKKQVQYKGNIRKVMNVLYHICCEEYGQEVVENIIYKKERIRASLDLTKVSNDFSPFGKEGTISISKINKYLSCPFTYYMDYILKVKEREIGGAKVRDNGTILHAIMEAFFGDSQWETMDIDEFVKEALDNFINLNKDYQYLNNDELSFTKRTIIETASKTLKILREKMKVTKFKPKYLEYEFGKGDKESITIQTPKRTLKLKGIIDRVDTCDKECLVIDYKTKSKIEFTPKEIWFGQTTQPLIYLKVLMQNLKMQPAGAYYFLLNNKLQDKEDTKNNLKYIGFSNRELIGNLDNTINDSNKESQLISMQERSGNSVGNILDTKEFEKLCDYSYDLIQNAAKEIEEGYIASSPMAKSPCSYCNYKAFCNINNHIERQRKDNCNKKAILTKITERGNN